MIRETYYTNTTGKHNKDYLMVMDDSTMTLTCTWGPIGGSKHVDRQTLANAAELYNLEIEKHARRMKNGYSLVSQNSFNTDSAEFASDLRDLVAAERLYA